MNNCQLRLLQYEEEENHFENIRMIEIEGKCWFVASDVVAILWYKNTSATIARHCKQGGIMKHYIPSESWIQNYILIDEWNVYRLIARSSLDIAEKFESWLFDEVIPQIRKQWFYWKINRIELPNFVERFKLNYQNVSWDKFSVITELFLTLYMELEKYWYQIPDKWINDTQMMPDISVWMKFSEYLKKNYPMYYESRETYTHIYPGWKKVKAYMYPQEINHIFKKFVFEEWIPKYADNYFSSRDPLALNYIPLVLWVKDSTEKTKIRMNFVKEDYKV